MGPETFEDELFNKFDGQEVQAPKNIWEGVEGALNADLVGVYARRQIFYKRLSAAAILLVFFMLGIILTTTDWTSIANNPESASKLTDGSTYNALLSNSLNHSRFNLEKMSSFSGRTISELSFDPDVYHVQPKSQIPSDLAGLDNYEKDQFSKQSLHLVDSKKTWIDHANVAGEIYPYTTLSASYTTSSQQKNSDSESKVWAGVQAGAGTFDSNLGSSVLSNSFDPAGLADAIGTGNFINPTTNISPEMDESLATSVSFDMGMQIGERWTVESGLAYTSVANNGVAAINVLDVFSIDNNNFEGESLSDVEETQFLNPLSSRDATLDVEQTFDHEVEVTNRVQFASLPIKAGYFLVDRKFSLRLNAGLSANYLVEGNVSDPTSEILNSDQLNLYNDWSFDGVGGMELGYALFSNFDLTLAPNYRYAITPISNVSTTPSRFTLQTGLRYTIR